MHELKKAIERVLGERDKLKWADDDVNALDDAIAHLREIYEAVKEKM